MSLMRLIEFGVNDSQSQVKQEEGSNPDHREKVNESILIPHNLDHCLDFRPTLQSNALKYRKHRVGEIVKISDIKIWIFVTFSTVVVLWTLYVSTHEVVWMLLAIPNVKASLLKNSLHQLSTSYSKDEEKEDKHSHSLKEHSK